uniref:Solute carrier family 35 member F2 n=1 Tax=Calidris pygmaea TaxID=425635 RepID=A0A8C3J5Y1_9CHAR
SSVPPSRCRRSSLSPSRRAQGRGSAAAWRRPGTRRPLLLPPTPGPPRSRPGPPPPPPLPLVAGCWRCSGPSSAHAAGLLRDSGADGFVVVHSPCKIPADPFSCCCRLFAGCRNNGGCRHFGREAGQRRAIVEHREIMRIQWNWKIALLFTAFALCMFGLYSFMPVVIKVTSATSVNLGILTADLYSLFFGLFLFFYKFSGLYILSFIIIMVGFILYCSTPTRTAEPTALPQPCSTGLDNAALKLEENDSEAPAVTVQFTRGETVVVSTD